MPDCNIGIIIVCIASLSTFFFATKELLVSPNLNHHRKLSIGDPKTISYKVHPHIDKVSDPGISEALRQIKSNGATSHNGAMKQYGGMAPPTEPLHAYSSSDSTQNQAGESFSHGDAATFGASNAATHTNSGELSYGGASSASLLQSRNSGEQIPLRSETGSSAGANSYTSTTPLFGSTKPNVVSISEEGNSYNAQSTGPKNDFVSSASFLRKNSGEHGASGLRNPSSGGMQSYGQQSGGFGTSSSDPATLPTGLPPIVNGAVQPGGTKPRRKLEFVHITKTGGTAIETAAADQANIMWGACHYRPIKYQKCESPDWPQVSQRIQERMPTGILYKGEPWHCPIHWQLPDMFQDVDTFVVVRNPYDRIVSEYYCSSYGYKGPNPDLLETFQAWVSGNVTEVKTRLQGHMLPQNYYVYDERGTKLIDHVLRYENISNEFDALMELYGIPVRLPSKSKGPQMFHTYNRKGITHEKHMSVADLSPDNIQKINEVYARDFEFFGYNMIRV